MAITIIPKKIQKIWEVWNLRGAVLVSLFLQILLICFASSRKRTASYKIHIVIWSSYLLADWVAAFAVGLISSTQGEKCEKVTVNDALAAFWAPFLLLHLGGPDTITAFSLEDNELWIRHMLGLIVQLLAVAYVFSQSIPNDFWLPTVLVFFAGSIKYAERTRALYLACLGNFKVSMRPKPDPGPNYAQLMEEYTSKRAAGVPSDIHRVPEPDKVARAFDLENSEKRKLTKMEIIKEAYRFFNIFKGLIVDHMFSFLERNESRKFFLLLEPHDAFCLMEVELNFLFDALFTKMAAVHNEVFKLGYIFRFTCTALIVAAFVLFTMHDKRNIHRFDIGITQALLVGAIFLDFIALIKLIFSNWTIALLAHRKIFSCSTVFNRLNPEKCILKIHRRISFSRRWSKSMSQHSLIRYCLKKKSKLLDRLDDIADIFGLKEILEEMLYKEKKTVEEELVDLIFNELKVKAEQAKETKDAKEIYSARGERALSNLNNNGLSVPVSVVMSVGEDVDYDQSVLTWHVATELCYFTVDDVIDENKTCNLIKHENRKWCKLLSDYLLYLLIMRPTMMSSVAGIAQIRFQDTYAEAIKFFSQGQLKSKTEKEACEKLLAVSTVVKPVEVKGDRSKSVLFDACILAKELKTLRVCDMWNVMSKVWLELLCYGASHCRGDAHAQQLSKGGELVTFVWLLMAHFGLGEQFRIEAGHARAKLIVEK